MTSYARGEQPKHGRFLCFDHVTFNVGNAKQAASYYVTKLGFEPLGYKGFENGERQYASHAVRQNKIIFLFQSAYDPDEVPVNQHVAKHGDAVKDVAFTVDDLESIVLRAQEKGATIVRDIWEEFDFNGIVRYATIQTYGDTTHTFVDRSLYRGHFLPGYTPVAPDLLTKNMPSNNADYIDHVVANHPSNALESTVKWYEDVMQFHRFWSLDDTQLHTEYSASRVIVMTNWEENILMPLNEPALGKKRSQIQEFVDYYGGPGVQHIALNTQDIVTCVRNLKARGMEFLDIPDEYYDIIFEKLSESKVEILEDFETLRELKILIDYDEEGYLLQIITMNMQDRPTLFIELIQRRNHNGFGAGNFKALFSAIEKQQAKRGNL
ncbi:hypothetical protein WA026_022550 [Henosepilachna vigintioctopunctata]|uniref:4-hydroxyphenylpyruvate dioxygenase n=1 Tax=Henosepilachna vigintioctopunctata TaxID=420089 RepID=A0AAW1VDI2_9CUCU